MAYDEALANRIRFAVADIVGVAERKMFGGVCFTVDGHMAFGVQDRDLMVRVGPDDYSGALSRAQTRPMDFTGKPMKGYIYVSEAGLKRRDHLIRWVKQAANFVQTLPPKAKERAKSA